MSLREAGAPNDGPTPKANLVFASASAELGEAWEKVFQALRQEDPQFSVAVVPTKAGFNGTSTEQISHVSVIPLNLKSSQTIPKSHEAVQAYQAFGRSHDFGGVRHVAIKLMNRMDFTGTLRFLERETLFSSFTMSAFDLLLNLKPKIVVFDVTPHEFSDFVLWSVAECLRIPVLFFQPCSLVPAMVARTRLDIVVAPVGARVGDSPLAEYFSELAQSTLSSLATGIQPSYMETQRRRDVTVARWRHKFLEVAATFRWLRIERYPESLDFSGQSWRSNFMTRAAKLFVVRSLQNTLRVKAMSLGRPVQNFDDYCVFALHYEPERTSLPEGLPIDFQLDAIASARTLVPEASELIVKEHYSQQTSALRGFLGRSPSFYDLVESLPRTRFAPTDSRLMDYVAGANCVFTLTGTIAIESVLRGVPVVYFGNPWWAGLPGTVRFDEVSKFSDLQSVCGSPSEAINALLDIIAKNMIPGSPAGSAQAGNRGSVPIELLAESVSSITQCICQVLNVQKM